MGGSFEDAVRRLAIEMGADPDPPVVDEHARWRLYDEALVDARRHAAVLSALAGDENSPLVSAVVVKAIELVGAEKRATWVDVLPAGRGRDYVQKRCVELEVLQRLLADDAANVNASEVQAWSLWLQLRLAEGVSNRHALAALTESGASKRIRHLARQRARTIQGSQG